jgi:hypothetical protein
MPYSNTASSQELLVLILIQSEIDASQPAAEACLEGMLVLEHHKSGRTRYEVLDLLRVSKGELSESNLVIITIAEAHTPPLAPLKAHGEAARWNCRHILGRASIAGTLSGALRI